MTADSASVNMGGHGGVIAQLSEELMPLQNAAIRAQRLPMCDPRVWDAHGTWQKHEEQIRAMADMHALSEQDQQRLQSHLEVYNLACPISNAPVESLLQLLKHGTGMFMELPALLELMSMRTHIDATDGVDVLDFAQPLPELRKEVRHEEAAAAMARRIAKAEMKAAAATHRQLAAGAGAAPGMLTPPSEQQGATAELNTSSTRKQGAGQYYWAYDTRYRALQVGSVAAAHDELAAPGSHNPPDFCHNLNCPDFEVLKDYGNGVQLRRYAPSTWAVTDVNETLYEKASAVGFQRLFKYILGNNNLEAKIDMTAPVVTEVNLDADDEFTDQYSVAFYLPWEYQAVVDEDGKKSEPSEVPGPKDDRVVIEDEPRADVYVLPFGSYALGFRVKKLAIDFFDFLPACASLRRIPVAGTLVGWRPDAPPRRGWKSKAVREGFRKVVEQLSRPSTDPRPDRLVIVDEFRTSRVNSSVHARQPCELHLLDDRPGPEDWPRPEDWIPPAGQVNQWLVRPAWSLRHAKYVRGLQWCHQEVGSVAAAHDELAAPGSHNPPDFCHNLDCPDFEVLKDYGNGVQLRRYVPSMWAMTDVNETLYEKASAVGFQRLSRYILGNNNLEAKIEQTTPVVTEVYLNMDDVFTEQYLVAFYLPWKYQPAVNKDNKQAKVPEPKDDRVIIADEPRALVYVLPFGSYAQGSKVKKLAIDFYDFLDQQGITNYERSTFMVAVYDKPYKPFNRHNEIWVLTCQALLSAMSADGEDMEAIEQFCLITGKDQGVAKEWLSLSENNVERAIGLFFENGPSVPPQRASSGPVDMTEEDAAAAAAAMQDVEEYGDLHVAGTTAPTSVAGTRRTSSSVLDDDEEDEAAMMRTMAHNRAAGREAAQEAERAIEATMDDDEALARRLMEEEERGLQGVGQGGHGPYHTLPSRAPRQGAAGASQLGRLGLEPEGLGGGRGGVRGASLLHPQGPGAGGRQGEGQGEEEEEEEEEEHTALGVGRQELEEARMIEAAMLGLPYEPRLPLRGRSAGGRQAGARGGPPLGDPDLHDGRSLRWEQDQAYEESLAADKAKADSSAEAAREAAAAARRLAEEAAAAERAAAEAAAKLKATLARKAAALVPEPAPGDPEAVTIMVRLPDGMRLSRKFKKSNALQAVFDYVDVQHQAATYLPGNCRYNLVNQFPRHVFQESDATGTLADMGIVSGTALFLEVVQ
ncbi:hypothetical protein QJQ45_000958 [Haematococcus lacustris]|nr:hypothetical protein QJQ45_000958 [Haematococcus lacustris]